MQLEPQPCPLPHLESLAASAAAALPAASRGPAAGPPCLGASALAAEAGEAAKYIDRPRGNQALGQCLKFQAPDSCPFPHACLRQRVA